MLKTFSVMRCVSEVSDMCALLFCRNVLLFEGAGVLQFIFVTQFSATVADF